MMLPRGLDVSLGTKANKDMFHSFRFLEGCISNFEGNPTMMLLTVNF